MEKLKRAIPIFLAILLLLPTIQILAPAHATSVNGYMDTGFYYGGSMHDDILLSAGNTHTLVFRVKNLATDQSLEQAWILINWTATLNTTAINVISANAYDSTDTFKGAWSYDVEVTNLTPTDTTKYLVVKAYTAPGSQALGQNEYVDIEVEIPFIPNGGNYQINITAFHVTSDYQRVFFDTEILNILLDDTPPEYTMTYPIPTGTVYYTAKISKTVSGDTVSHEYIYFNYTVKDPYHGSSYLDLSTYPVTVTVRSFTITDNDPVPPAASSIDGYYDVITTLSPDNMEMYLSFRVNFTAYENDHPGVLTSGDLLTLWFSLADAAGNSVEITMTATMDFDAPTVSIVDIRHSDTTSLYYDGTRYWANDDDTLNGITIIFDVNDALSGAYNATLTLNSVTYTASYDSGTGHWYVTIPDTDMFALTYYTDYTIEVEAYDYAYNHLAYTPVATLQVDPDAPQLDVSDANGLLDEGVEYWYSADITWTIVADDGIGSGFSSSASSITIVRYMHYGDTASVPPVTNAWSGSLSITDEGWYEIIFTLQDNAGNEFTYTYFAGLDKSAPWSVSATVSLDPSHYDSDTGTWYTDTDFIVSVGWEDIAPVRVTVKVIDIDDGTTVHIYIGDGLAYSSSPFNAHIFVGTDITEYDNYRLEITVEESVTYRDGGLPRSTSATDQYFVYNEIGPSLDGALSDIDDIRNQVIDPDYTSPTTLVFKDLNAVPASSIMVYFDGALLSGWTSTHTLIAGGPHDPSYAGYTITLDFSGVVGTLYTEGDHNLTVVLTDYAGLSMVYAVYYNVDTSPPTLTATDIVPDYTGSILTFNDITVVDNYGGNIYLSITFSGGDLAGPIIYVTDEIHANPFNLNTVSIDLASLGLNPGVTYTVTIKLKDQYAFDNGISGDPDHEVSISDTFTIDGAAPTCTPDPMASTWVNVDPYTVTVELTDNPGIGVDTASIAVTVDGSPVDPADITITDVGGGVYEVSFQLTGEGWHTIEVDYADLIGNSGSCVFDIGIDVTPPEITINVEVMQGALMMTISIMDTTSGLSDGVFQFTIDYGSGTVVFSIERSWLTAHGYYAISHDGTTASFPTIEGLYTFIGNEYAYAYSTAAGMAPFIVVMDGNFIVFTGYQTADENIEITISDDDLAGNVGTASTINMTPAGATMPICIWPGWNLVSTPMINSVGLDTMTNWLRLNGSSITAVYVYTSSGWQVYIPGVTDPASLPSFGDGMGVWVRYDDTATGIAYLMMQGTLPFTPTAGSGPPEPLLYEVPAGENYLGFTSPRPMVIGDYLNSLIGHVYDFAYFFDAQTQTWTAAYISPMGVNVYPGSGMWVYAYENTTLIVPAWWS